MAKGARRRAPELTSDAAEIEVDYATEQAAFGYLGGGEGGEFTVWDGDDVLASVPAEVGEGTVRLPGPAGRPPRRCTCPSA